MNDILLPLSLMQHPDRFGGVTDGDCLRGAPVIRDGRLIGLENPQGGQATMVIPALIEAHCHLDKCHTAHRLRAIGGDLTQAIDRQRTDKATWTEDDIRTRAHRGISEACANGCRTLRTHVDWGDAVQPPLAWSVLSDCADEEPNVQLAALTGITQWTDPGFADAVGQSVAASDGVLGAFVFGQEGYKDGLASIFRTAQKRDLMLDFHVDEGFGALNGLETIADTAIATRFDRPILCGHAVSLMDRNKPDLNRIIDKLLAARITICTLPITNLYLQGRNGGTPDRRGITRMRELFDAGVSVVVGSDNVGDSFCPLGAHDPMAALALASIAAHLDPPMGQWLPAITTHAAAAIGLEPTYLDHAALEALLTCSVSNTADLVSCRAPLRPATKTLT